MNDASTTRKWARTFAAFPAIVRVACSHDGELSLMGYSFHCVSNGDVVLAPAGRLGEPSLISAVSLYQRLVFIGYMRRFSKLSMPELDRALEYPDDRGYLVFCLSRTEPVSFSLGERARLVDEVIDSLCFEASADPLSMLQGQTISDPAVTISPKDARIGIRPSQITPWFLAKCRLAVHAAVSTTLDELLKFAHQRCNHEEKLAAMF